MSLSSIAAFFRTPRGRRIAKALVALVLAVAGVGGASLLITDPDGAPTKTVVLDGADADTVRDDELVLDEEAQGIREDAAEGEFEDLEGNMRGKDPAMAGKLDGPLAAQEWPGCKTAFVRSFSSRRGVKPRAIAYHYTAGPNVPGWADLDGLTAYSNNAANQVSWHFAVDREGHCTYNVPINHKSWTIAALNPETINFEIVGTGRELDYAGTAGLAKVAQITKRISRLTGIPIRLGATDGRCHVTRTGIITHWMGSVCSGGHHDVKPYVITAIIAKVRQLLKPPPAPPVPRPTRCRIVAYTNPTHPAVRFPKTRHPGPIVNRLRRNGYRRIVLACA